MFSWSERRKIERRLRRLEKMQRSSSGPSQDAELAGQLSKLKEDLEYVRVSFMSQYIYVEIYFIPFFTFFGRGRKKGNYREKGGWFRGIGCQSLRGIRFFQCV